MKQTSLKGKSPWKVKKIRGSRAGGIVIPKGAILVNQGLRKVKLEEDFVEQKPSIPLPIEIGQDENSRTTSTEAVSDGESVNQKYEVIKANLDIPNVPMTSEKIPAAPIEDDGHDRGGSSYFPEEIESLKCTVKQLSLQIEKQSEVNKKQDDSIRKQGEAVRKQNDVIGGMKSLLRNIGLSITTFFNDCEEQEKGGCHENNEEFPGNSCRFTVENSLMLKQSSSNPSLCDHVTLVTSEEVHQRESVIANVNGTGGGSDSKVPADESSIQASVFMESSSNEEPSAGQSTENYNMNLYDGEDIEDGNEDSSGSPETSSNEVDVMAGQNAEEQEDSDLDNDLEDNAEILDDSSYVPDDSEEDSDNGMEDDQQDRQGNHRKSAKLVVKTTRKSIRSTTDSAANSEGSFPCSKCGKKYKTKNTLSVHLISFHSGKSQEFKCHLCPRVFKSRSGLFQHNSSTHEHVRYKCAHCPGTFAQIVDVVKHEKCVHSKGGPPTQECKICGIHLVNSKNRLHVHIAKVHNKSRAKPLSKEETQKKKEGRSKNKKRVLMRRTKVFKCQLCPSSFPERKDLLGHLSQSHKITGEADGKN